MPDRRRPLWPRAMLATRWRAALLLLVWACGPGPTGTSSTPPDARTSAPVDAASSAALDERGAAGAGDESAAGSGTIAVVDDDALSRIAIRHQAWPGGRVIAETRPDVWRTRVAPGSLMKMATTVAAIDGARLDPAMRFVCRRRERVAGRVLDCVHPPLGASLSLADALAHSCNSVFLQLAARLTREDLESGLARLGVPAQVSGQSVALAAVGLDGVDVEPWQWGAAMVRVARGETPISPRARAVLLEGLRRAVTEGTAQALSSARPDSLAKTSTAPLSDGSVRAMVAMAWPHQAPAHSLVVAAAGVSGRDAVNLAAAWLRRAGLSSQAPPGARGAADPPSTGAPRDPSARGSVRVGRATGSGYRIETMALEAYVAQVVAAEAPGRAPGALHDAMAIVARTFAEANRGRHARDGFDLCDLTHCQVLGTARDATRAAAARTRALVLTEAGEPRRVYYHASCAGWLEPAARVWPGTAATRDESSEVPRRDPVAHPLETWTSEVRAADLERALASAGLSGASLEELRLVRSATTGRVERVHVLGMVPGDMSGEAFRGSVGRTLGWHVLKSPYFTATPTAGGFRFAGAGRGHGVGLCVRGAQELAERGQTAREILAAYVPAARLAPVAGVDAEAAASTDGTPSPAAQAPVPSFTLRLPASAEPQRERLEQLIARMLGELTARLGAAPPGTLTIRFHPTHESFRRATGSAEWVSGVTVGTVRTRGAERTTESRVELMPLALLERRGALSTTLRHELAHALTGPTLAERPRWVHEGVAVWATGELVAVQGKGCPRDAEFDAARSSEALGRIYARAAGCVADAMARGVHWSDVGR